MAEKNRVSTWFQYFCFLLFFSAGGCTSEAKSPNIPIADEIVIENADMAWWSPSGKYILVSMPKSLQVIVASSGEVIHTLTTGAHLDRPSAVSWMPDESGYYFVERTFENSKLGTGRPTKQYLINAARISKSYRVYVEAGFAPALEFQELFGVKEVIARSLHSKTVKSYALNLSEENGDMVLKKNYSVFSEENTLGVENSVEKMLADHFSAEYVFTPGPRNAAGYEIIKARKDGWGFYHSILLQSGQVPIDLSELLNLDGRVMLTDISMSGERALGIRSESDGHDISKLELLEFIVSPNIAATVLEVNLGLGFPRYAPGGNSISYRTFRNDKTCVVIRKL